MLKRAGFRKKTLNEVIAQQAKKKRTTVNFKRSKAIKKPKKIKEHWKPPAWFMAIPTGSHGSNPIQKRLWKLTSDYVRIRDWETWGKCVSSNESIPHWKLGDCGHFKRWTSCNAYFKFHTMNLALQSKGDNGPKDGADVGHRFGEEMKRRYGDNILELIEEENKKYQGQKFDNIKLVMMAQELLVSMSKLSEKPDYYEKVIEKM